MNSIYDISLDLHKTSAPISLSVKQGDTGREIHISLTDGSTPYKIPDGSYAVFAGTKPDNKVLWNSCTIKDNTIIYEMTEQTVVVVGWIPVQIRLYSAGGKLLTSPDFVLIVDEPAVADGTIVAVSDNEITALTQLVTECTALKADLEEFKTGGYYTPVVTQPDENTLQIDFTPSSEEMPAVESAKVTLPGGSGSDSTQNGNGVHIGPEPPDDTSLLWIDTGDNGEDAPRYYTVTVTQPDANQAAFDFLPSVEGMAAVQQQTVTLPAGPQGPQGEQGPAGADGQNGADGYTPVRGTDYWTDEDKAEIKAYVDEAILGGTW